MIRVGVIRGGVNNEYDMSLATGAHVLDSLRNDMMKDKYQAIDLFIDKEGMLHCKGLPMSIDKLHDKVDIVFNALHGSFGQDGKLQQILDHWQIPYTGSGIFPHSMGYNRRLARERFNSLDIQTPQHILLPLYQVDFDGPVDEYAINKAKMVWNKMPAPWVVKPIMGNDMGIHVCKTFDDLVRAIRDGVAHGVGLIIEEMITGREAHVGVINNFRKQNIYTLPAVEVRADGRHVYPGKFTNGEKEELASLTALIHQEFHLDNYSNVKFIVHPVKGIYAINVNTLPSLAEGGIWHKSIDSVGSTMPEFIDHVLQAVLRNK
jgi:D-alanine-D-alanine ligase